METSGHPHCSSSRRDQSTRRLRLLPRLLFPLSWRTFSSTDLVFVNVVRPVFCSSSDPTRCTLQALSLSRCAVVVHLVLAVEPWRCFSSIVGFTMPSPCAHSRPTTIMNTDTSSRVKSWCFNMSRADSSLITMSSVSTRDALPLVEDCFLRHCVQTCTLVHLIIITDRV